MCEFKDVHASEPYWSIITTMTPLDPYKRGRIVGMANGELIPQSHHIDASETRGAGVSPEQNRWSYPPLCRAESRHILLFVGPRSALALKLFGFP